MKVARQQIVLDVMGIMPNAHKETSKAALVIVHDQETILSQNKRTH